MRLLMIIQKIVVENFIGLSTTMNDHHTLKKYSESGNFQISTLLPVDHVLAL